MTGSTCAWLGRNRLRVVARRFCGIALTLCTSHRHIAIVCSLSRCTSASTQAASPLLTLTGLDHPRGIRLGKPKALYLGDSSLSTLLYSLALIRLYRGSSKASLCSAFHFLNSLLFIASFIDATSLDTSIITSSFKHLTNLLP